ncbi:MAG TPA: hypothetical protein VEK37_03460 [Gemmatimonadaceae bacterium]|nr:hypothetical protein [Gemmatimonadaceae bacterium]
MGAPKEASTRGACGRAYYAAFIVARDLLVKAKFPFQPRGVHQRVADLLRQSTDKDVKARNLDLDQLRNLREQSDYEVGDKTKKGFAAGDSQRAILLSNTIITSFQTAAKKDSRLFIPAHVV